MASSKESQNTEDESKQCAKYLKALGDPVRIRIIRALQHSSLAVTDLSNLLEMEVANISHHLRVLYHADIVQTRRDGRFIYYEINQSVLKNKPLSKTLDFGCCSLKMEK